MADSPAVAISAGCDECGSDAAVLLSPRASHERWARRLPAAPDDTADPQWRCAGCLSAALESGAWCALGVGGPHSDPRRTGVLVAHARDGSDVWAQMCGLLAAVPERMLASVAIRPCDPAEPWLLLWRFPDGVFAECAFDSAAALVAAMVDVLEGIVTAETAAGY